MEKLNGTFGYLRKKNNSNQKNEIFLKHNIITLNTMAIISELDKLIRFLRRKKDKFGIWKESFINIDKNG